MKRILPVIILMTLMACAGKETRAVLDDVASYISERPDSALTVLKSIDTDNINGHRANAQYALLYSMALDKNAIDETNDSLVMVATTWYRRHGIPDDRLKAFYYHGRVRQNAGDNEGAMEHFVRAESYAATAEDDYAKGLLYNEMGNVYMDIFETKMANEAYLHAKDYFLEAGRPNQYAGTLMNIARYEIECKNHEAAKAMFMGVRSLWDVLNQNSKGIYYFQLINFYLYVDSEDLSALHDCIKQYLSDVDAALIRWLKLTEGYLRLGKYSAAMSSLENHRKYNEGYETDPVYQMCAYELYDSCGMVSDALEAYKIYTRIVNNTTAEIVTQDTAFIKERYENDMLIMKKQNTILAILLCATLFAMLLLIVIHSIKKRLATKEEEMQHYLEECSSLELERDTLNELIESNCLINKDALEVISSRLDLLNCFFASAIQDDDNKDKAASKEFKYLIGDKYKFLRDTRMVFAGIYPKFISSLKDRGLSDYQIEVCCLYALGFKGKDVMNYTNRKRHYIDNMDIRAKLGLTEHDRNLDKYILNLLNKLK